MTAIMCGIRACRLNNHAGTRLFTLILLLWISSVGTAQGVDEMRGGTASRDARLDTAEVTIDGRVVIHVRGTKAFSAERRAAEIRQQIIAAARDESIPAGSVTLEQLEDRTQLMAGNRLLLDLFDADAEVEGIGLQILAESKQELIQEALINYRRDRSTPVLLTKTLYSLAAALVTVGLLFGYRKGFRVLGRYVEKRLKNRLKTLEAQSARFIRSQQVAKLLCELIKWIKAILIVLTLYLFLNFVLGLYPWTRGLAIWLFGLILNPLSEMGRGLVAIIPDLTFLVILYFVTRYILRMIRVFFRSIGRGTIKLGSFEQDWALPTFRILRLVVVVFALVMAYPHIPGSQSEAFKGISLLLGLIISLGSSSIISNIIAGYSLTYRRPFKIGDWIRIDDTEGVVMETRVLVTRLRSPKNQEIVIPNTSILNGEVHNLTTLARKRGLILHTTVGIGYETPWRQVDAMLKLAAARTSELLAEPAPFVLKTGLADFAVTYELNVYCADPEKKLELYSTLHENILDVFNEYEVAIMTPSYITDTPDPKLVPRDQWYTAPATPPSESDTG